jgi:hypothetical protein
MAASLHDWGSSRIGSTLDDLSLLPAGGQEISHTSNLMDWLSALDSYQPDARSSDPTLDILLRAVDVASDATPRPGMKRAVLFITAPMEGDQSFGIQNLLALTKEQDVRIFVWLIASPDAFTSPSADLLKELTEETGGQFYTYSGIEPIVSIESHLEPLREIYSLTYDSRITTGGVHRLAAEIQLKDGQIRTPDQAFQFDLQPPDPAFLSPTLQIFRKFSGFTGKNLLQAAAPSETLAPAEQELQVLIDFPDGHSRQVVKSTLYVDGEIVDENSGPPFDQFTWDLTRYTVSGEHLLRVEVMDELGLTGSSIETPFQIKVEAPTANPLAFVVGYWPVIAGLGVLLLGAVTVLVLILGGHIRPQAGKISRRLRRLRINKGLTKQSPPLKSQPVHPQSQQSGPSLPDLSERRLTGWVNRIHWPHRRLAPQANAYLTRLSEFNPAADTAVPIPVTADELTFGCDPQQATLVLDDHSVDGLHARLVRKEDGSFWLADEGSIAGTWVNYASISSDGVPLEHGDLIHIGRVNFRFTQRDPLRQRKPVITEENTP